MVDTAIVSGNKTENITFLYPIRIRHCAPKDCIELTVFAVAQSDNQVVAGIDTVLNHGIWMDRHQDGDVCEIYDDDYNFLGEESYLSRMLRIRGEFYDEDADFSDAYYGITHYGWDQPSLITIPQADMLINLDVAYDWRGVEWYRA